MRIHTPLIILALFTLALTSCSKHPQTANLQKTNDLGVINVSSGKPNSYTLADGRICTITPTLLPDGNVNLDTTVIKTNATGWKRSSLSFQTPVIDRAYTFSFDKETVFRVRLHIADDKSAVLPGRHMSESQVAEIVKRELPAIHNFSCQFTNGVWEIMKVETGSWISSTTTNANGHIVVHSTHPTQLILRVSDTDGKIDRIKSS